MTSTKGAERAPAPWSPLRHPVFRALWIAGLVSDFGAWMHQVGEAWLMTSLSPSPLLVALLQSADSLAIFLFSLPAGALADVVDRRRLAIVTQAWLLLAALALGLLTLGGAMTPWTLIALSFVMSIGAALDAPVWQAIVPEVIPRQELPQAVALGGVSINIARAIAPALGGLVVAAVGPYAVFLLNAATFVYVIAVLVRWRPARAPTNVPRERLVGAVRRGLRYVRHSPDLLAAFFRTGVGLFGGSCLLALLPVFARRELSLESTGYGLLYGCMGVGAVLSLALLPNSPKRPPELTFSAGTIGFAIALLALAASRSVWVAAVAMVGAGVAWMSMLTSLNVAVQVATPSWVRARVLSVYMIVFQGTIALGSALWGTLADKTNLRLAFIVSGVTMLVGGLAGRRWFPLGARIPDLSPSLHWPKPVLMCEPTGEAGPVLVTVEYRVSPGNEKAFIAAANSLQRLRRRNGAYQWELFRDPSSPDRFVEVYLVDSWADHLLEHERLTVDQRDAETRLRELIVPGTQPVVTHFIAASGDGDSET